MGSSSNQVSGYRYYMGLHAGLCHGPVDELIEIRGGDATLWIGSKAASGQITIDAVNAYGGDDKEGGVSGKLDVMMGESTQMTNSYLTSVIGGLQSAYRGLCTLVFRQGYIGANNPYPKPWAFRVRRATKGWQNDSPWYSSKAQITLSNGVKAMNPAHIVYEVLTNRDWGMGYPSSIIDDTAFRASADELYTEGLGLCLLWTRTDTIESFLQLVIDHSGGVLVQSKTTGLFLFNLIRGGYSVGSLPVITRDNIIDLESVESTTITGATNELTITWIDPTQKVGRTTTMQALGAIQAQGVIVSASTDYPGIASDDLAQRVAQRDLRAVSVPLKRIKLKLDRTAWTWLPGSLFVLAFPDIGISSVVFRVGEIDYGTLTDGAITVTAVEDVFALASSTYLVSPSSGWVPPSNIPAPSPYAVGIEADYRSVYLAISSYDLSILPSSAGYAGLLSSRPSGLATNYEIWTAVSPAAAADRGVGHFTPTGTLHAAIAPFDTAITIDNGVDLDIFSVPCAAVIDNEVVLVSALDLDTSIATIARGCTDTVPVSHSSGARIWFYDFFNGSDGVQYFSGETVGQQALVKMSGGAILPIASAPTINCAINGRASKPYPPANFHVNGARWDLLAEIIWNISLSWAERNRVTQQDQLIDNLQGSLTPESGTTYTVTLKDGGGTGFYTATGVTGTTWTWASPDEVHSAVSITISSVRGGLTSTQSQTLPVTQRYGHGLQYGNNYGSI